jgi:hypothetical protein
VLLPDQIAKIELTVERSRNKVMTAASPSNSSGRNQAFTTWPGAALDSSAGQNRAEEVEDAKLQPPPYLISGQMLYRTPANKAD